MIRKRLHRQIYFAVFLCLVLMVVFSAILFSVVGERGPNNNYRNVFQVVTGLTKYAMPEPDLPLAQQAAAIERLGAELNIAIALFTADGEKIGSYKFKGRDPNFKRLRRKILDGDGDHDEGGWLRNSRGGYSLLLEDGRWFVARPKGFPSRPPLAGVLIWLALITAAIGLGAWPFVKRLTGRLARLQTGVEQIGAGNLSARVPVEGKDEVAALATSFNDAASTIERLINSNRQLLANASHELRTPLARVRLGVELMKDGGTPARRAALERDIAELDSLIDEILIMSRLDTGTKPNMNEEIDLLALAAEECARYDTCVLNGENAVVLGSEKLLRRLIRNLVGNAHKHGKPPIDVSISAQGKTAVLTVYDAGDGIPKDLRETMFEPFHRAPGKQNVDGYGLGLALVRQIAEAHNGQVQIVDEGGRECVFKVSLPMKSEA